MNHIELGGKGEDLAVKELEKKGYKLLERNFRWKHSEIDIICKKDEFLVVVEVKTRHSSGLGEPYMAVTIKKQKQIIKVANEYIRQKNRDEEVRFDVVSIVMNNSGVRLEHIENAFYPLV